MEGLEVKMSEGGDVKMSGLELARGLVGERDAQSGSVKWNDASVLSS